MVTGLVRVSMPSGRTMLALAPLIALLLGLVVYSLVDLRRADKVPYLPKLVWALIILASVPLGAVAYLLFGKDRSGHNHPVAHASARRSA